MKKEEAKVSKGSIRKAAAKTYRYMGNLSTAAVWYKYVFPCSMQQPLAPWARKTPAHLPNALLSLKKKEKARQVEEAPAVYEKKENKEFLLFQRKYHQLLEDYNNLLEFLIKVADQAGLPALRGEITSFIDKNKKA